MILVLVGLEERTGSVRQITDSKEHFVLVTVAIAFTTEIAVSDIKWEKSLKLVVLYCNMYKISTAKYFC